MTSSHDSASSRHNKRESDDIEAGTAATIVKTKTGESEDQTVYPSGRKLILIIIALYLSIFLVALDRTILGTAIPRITDDFHSLGDIGWYGSSFLLTGCAFQLIYGRIYTFYSPKWVFLISIAIFEIGSAVCGAAPSSTAFIVGRAVAGLGSAGVLSGAIVIITYSAPLHKRPMFQGLLGAVFGVASVAGPLVGGAFTQHVSWRWCFYINLPVGAITIVLLVFILHLPNMEPEKTSLRQKIERLDPIGTALFLPGVVCLVLALQWGGSVYPWGNGRVIACLVLFAVLMIAFVGVQIWKQENATIPPRIFVQRSILAGFFFTTFVAGSMLVIVYFLPVWFQAIKGVSAVRSGLMILPTILSLVVASILSGILVTRIGYYKPSMIVCSTMMAIGAGLITTFTVNTNHSKWIGFQVIFGLGLGQGMQQANLAAQTVLSRKDVATGASLMFFAQNLGGAIFIAVAQNVFSNLLVHKIGEVTKIDPRVIVGTGATQLRSVVPPSELGRILVAYNSALTRLFFVSVACASVSIFGALAMEWRSVKAKKQAADKRAAQKAAAEKEAAVEAPTEPVVVETEKA